VKTERDRRNLKEENDTLRQELEAVNADLTSTRKALQTLKVRQQRMTVKKRHPAVTEQKRSPVPPQAAAPPPLIHGASPRVQSPSQLDTVEAGTAKIYSIR
jgi:alkanesulfonate monooxygenase SsuD/methylene tetrahydromethanopterin reductase-like flavin-dependent oxidoreductase (luciferase family)